MRFAAVEIVGYKARSRMTGDAVVVGGFEASEAFPEARCAEAGGGGDRPGRAAVSA